jgi:hypothetical protein
VKYVRLVVLPIFITMQVNQTNLKKSHPGLRKAIITALLSIAFFGTISYLDYQSEIKKYHVVQEDAANP